MRAGIWLPLGLFTVCVGWAGCAAGDDPPPDDTTSAGGSGTTQGPTTTTSTGGPGSGGMGGGQGGGGGSEFPCGQDCSLINAPQCFRSVCNMGEFQGPIGSCVVVPEDDGTACDDELFCTVDDTCQAGVCTGGPANTCGMTPAECQEITCDEDNNSCSQQAVADGGACTPGDLCQTGGTCTNGICLGTPVDCFFTPVPNECFAAVCNPMNGMCEPIPANDGGPCIDQNDLCSDGNTCNNGVCAGGGPKDCSGLTAGCDLGVCDPMNGQCTTMAVMDGQMCDDLDACTTGEICTTGMCGGGSPVTTCSGAMTADGCCPSNCTVANDLDCACGIDDIVIQEVSTASPDFVLLKNTSSCALDIDPITVCKDEGASELCDDLPSFILQPGAEVYLIESPGSQLPPAPAQSLTLGFSMGWEGTSGAIFICDGPCTQASATNATDAVIWQRATPGSTVSLPTGINFSPGPVPGVNGTDDAVLRVNTNGSFPNFFASDWVAAPASFD